MIAWCPSIGRVLTIDTLCFASYITLMILSPSITLPRLYIKAGHRAILSTFPRRHGLRAIRGGVVLDRPSAEAIRTLP